MEMIFINLLLDSKHEHETGAGPLFCKPDTFGLHSISVIHEVGETRPLIAIFT